MTAVLFDLDGTLTDRERSVRHLQAGFRQGFGDRLGAIDDRALEDTLVRCDQSGYNGRRGHDLVEALPWQGRAPTPADIEAFWERESAEWLVARPGLVEVVRGLRAAGFGIGIVTNGLGPQQRRKLENLGVAELLDAIVVSAEIGLEKPDPRIFAHALDALGAEARESWFVGDHPEKDVAGAEAAGMRAVWIRGGLAWPASAGPPRHAIETLGELPPLLGPAAAS